jgi:hypothetical protein
MSWATPRTVASLRETVALPHTKLTGFLVSHVLSQYDSIPWIVPTVAGTFLATSILLVFAELINYPLDSYLMFAASAMAANTLSRSACATAAPLSTQNMFAALGVS